MLELGIPKNNITEFTKEELKYITSFDLGMICMIAKIGRIDEPKEFLTRINTTATMLVHWPIPDFFNIEFVEKMKVSKWNCNVTTESTEVWEEHLKTLLLDDLRKRTPSFEEE